MDEDGDEECRDKCSSASCPPAAMSVESGRRSAERVFGVNGRFAIARFEPERKIFCSKIEFPCT
jgi:hypothetical protein